MTIDELAALVDAATQGPWDIPEENLNGRIWAIGPVAGYDYSPLEMRHDSADVALVALYRTAAPKLARALMVAMEALRQIVDDDEDAVLAEIEAELR